MTRTLITALSLALMLASLTAPARAATDEIPGVLVPGCNLDGVAHRLRVVVERGELASRTRVVWELQPQALRTTGDDPCATWEAVAVATSGEATDLGASEVGFDVVVPKGVVHLLRVALVDPQGVVVDEAHRRVIVVGGPDQGCTAGSCGEPIPGAPYHGVYRLTLELGPGRGAAMADRQGCSQSGARPGGDQVLLLVVLLALVIARRVRRLA